MAEGFFITSTGTGAGKTLFTAGLLIMMRESGINAVPMKAVQTGAGRSKISPDLALVLKLAGIKPAAQDQKNMQPYLYSDACSPHLAAERDKKKSASAAGVKAAVERLGKKYRAVIAEGAGGLLVPLDGKKKECVIDTIKRSGLKAILICPAGLGAINYACLSIEAMKNRGIKIAGFVLNDMDGQGPGYIKKDNAKTISRMTGVKYLGTIPHMKKINRESLSRVFFKLCGLNRLVEEFK